MDSALTGILVRCRRLLRLPIPIPIPLLRQGPVSMCREIVRPWFGACEVKGRGLLSRSSRRMFSACFAEFAPRFAVRCLRLQTCDPVNDPSKKPNTETHLALPDHLHPQSHTEKPSCRQRSALEQGHPVVLPQVPQHPHPQVATSSFHHPRASPRLALEDRFLAPRLFPDCPQCPPS